MQFTGDPAVIIAALEKIKSESVGGIVTAQRRTSAQNEILQQIIQASMRVPPELPSYFDALGVCTVYAATVQHDANQTIGALQGLMTALSPIPGRKILVLATEALPARAGEEMFVFLDGIKEKFDGGTTQNPMVEITKYDIAPKIQALGDAANASGFTLYPIYATGLAGGMDGADVAGSLQVEMGNAVSASRDVARTGNAEPLLTLASRTGGRMSMGGNNFSPAFDGVASDLENYYGSFAVYIGFVRADGSVSKISRDSRTFAFPAATAARRKSIAMEVEVAADAATSRIAVGVLDQASKSTGFASAFIGKGPEAK